MKPKLAIIILTYNEEIHLDRCIKSIAALDGDIYVVDSFSTDKTLDIAKNNNARILQNRWINYSTQFNWALDQLKDYDWVMRIDADEFVTKELEISIRYAVSNYPIDYSGYIIERYMTFQRKTIKYGGIFPINVVRIFDPKVSFCEYRWMDEHIIVDGNLKKLSGAMVDDNLNGIDWWIAKHNSYANREALDLLNIKFNFLSNPNTDNQLTKQARIKRYIKKKIYSRLPLSIRSFFYFFIRYILRMGFLDGFKGFTFHFMQGFWYRLLVDIKVKEVIELIDEGISFKKSVKEKLGIDIDI